MFGAGIPFCAFPGGRQRFNGGMLCDQCHEREATWHSMTIIDGVPKKADLCLVCFEQSASPEQQAHARHIWQVIGTGKCRYCGAQPVFGSIFSPDPGIGDEQTRLLCEQCRLDLVEFNRRPENSVLDDFDATGTVKVEQRSRLLAEIERREEFMRQRVRERKSQ